MVTRDLLDDLEREVHLYETFYNTKYLQLKKTNQELEQEVKYMELLSESQENNLKYVIRQNLLADAKLETLKANLTEAQDALNRLTVRPEDIATAKTAKLKARAARLNADLDATLSREVELAKRLVALKRENSDLEHKYLSRMNPTLTKCCEHWDWTQFTNQFTSITEMYEYLVQIWAARGSAPPRVDEAVLETLVEKDLKIINNPDDSEFMDESEQKGEEGL
ncbi:uncharacterized protein LOC103509027 [Diaphorina citri]|uniref:Uncharacterized protein LOC103509027 n=1 Tax=Diaphorina citri TaxID=121845 RepID=A0A1S3D0S1_DIACI|nr:uncharacterized protein LOC103509027 [Diaphorina citri]KAI5706820.1 hypothetical protein M8J75_011657 [Diaphorina citri]KAI5741690.1 hypothetical protein M8J76_016124 [Diaphorina citri]KAI5747752.1 hypothetical protein M8J77_018160 [Diaphorina citri]